MPIVLSEDSKATIVGAADCKFENCYISDGQPEAAHASTEVCIDPNIADGWAPFSWQAEACFWTVVLGVTLAWGALLVWSLP